MQPPDPHPPAAPRRSRLPLILLLVALAATIPCGGLLLLLGMGALFYATEREQTLTPADRGAVVTVEEVQAAFSPQLDWLTPTPAAESLTKSKALDGSVELEYEYEHSDETRPMYTMTSITVDRTAGDAKTSYSAMGIGAQIGLAFADDGETRQIERNDLFRWGDESQLSLLEHEGGTVGVIFRARKDRRSFMFAAAVWIDDPEAIRALLEPKLVHLETYEP